MKKWTDDFKPADLILYEDANFIALNKPAGVKTQEDTTSETSLISWIEHYKKSKLHIVNRLDRPVSGVILFSKNRTGNRLAQDRKILSKTYISITRHVPDQSGKLSHFIMKDGRRKKAIVSNHDQKGYKACSLEYERLHQMDNYDILLIKTFSGRFHQIRAQLAHIGFPIKGDVKYGARRSNKDRSIDLHALSMVMPGSMKQVIAIPLGREKIWQDLIALNLF